MNKGVKNKFVSLKNSKLFAFKAESLKRLGCDYA
jgi:hypothetical protein